MKYLKITALNALLVLTSPSLVAQQTVFLDFDSATAGADHVYSTSERDQIIDLVREDYARFNFDFTLTAPTTGVFSTVTLNSGPAFGLADDLDFRNLNFGDNATVDVNAGATTSQEFVLLTANVASHELGHLQGLRHGDSFGPIGSGIDLGTVGPTDFNPDFFGPAAAVETQFHLMETDNVFVEDSVNQFFSERSAIRLTFNESGTVVDELPSDKSTLATAQDITLGTLVVPNTIEVGSRAGLGDFDVDALVVTGSLDSVGEFDLFQFVGEAGDLFNFEVISQAPDRFAGDNIDPQLTILDASGNPVDYFGVPAFNDDEFETFDSIIIDLVLPSDGVYFAQVNAFDTVDTGAYELFLHRFNGVVAVVPEPSSAVVLSMLMLGATCRRRKATR